MADADFHSKYTGEQIEEILDGAVLDNRYKQASAVQRARARTNIGATADEMQVVSFALSQELTKDQKAIARKNIGAGSSDIGLVIKGYVNTVDELQEIVGKDGEAYGVGTAYPYDIYIWDSYRDIWVNNGNIRGADGTDANVTSENIQKALGAKPLTVDDALTLEEIAASTALSGKVASAEAVKNSIMPKRFYIRGTEQFVIDYDQSYYITEKSVALMFTGHFITTAENNIYCLYPSEIRAISGTIFGAVAGGRWSANRIRFSYIGETGLTSAGDATVGEYFHVNAVIRLQ